MTIKSKSNNSYSNRYFLMRHGESLANRRGIIVSKPENALNGFGLTPRGAEQVMQAALNTRLDRDTLVVSSDFKRAFETAEIMHSILSVSDTQVQIDTKLRERDFGDLELQDHGQYNDVWQHDLCHPNKRFKAVETVEQTLSRGLNVITKLEHDYTGRNILLVGHGDVLQILSAFHHDINPRFHRSLATFENACLRSLSKLDLATKSSA